MKPALQTRLASFLILKDVLEKKITVPLAFSRCKEISNLSSIDVKFVRMLVLTTLRHYGQSKEILKKFLKKKLSGKKKDVEFVLVMAVVQLKFLKTPPHAVLDTAVELIKHLKQKHFASLVNAVLHSVAKDEGKIPDVLTNLPDWLCDKWMNSYSKDEIRGFLSYFYTEPMLDISVKSDANLWAEKLEATVLPTGTLRRHFSDNMTLLDGFADGNWWVQEASAALPALLFSSVDGKHGADLCSAPGGKTAQLVMRGAQVDAYDISENRLGRLRENLERLKIQDKVQVICTDALDIEGSEKYDFILLDAPCSATGTMKRHPELMYLRTHEDVERLSQLQYQLLEKAVQLLKVGGELVYSTCSLEKEENETLVQLFLNDHIDMVREVPQNEVLKPFLNAFGAVEVHPSEMVQQDGFYAVLLKKQ